MATTGIDTHKESDGQAVTVSLDATVYKDQVAYVDGWLGVAAGSGDSGDSIALDIGSVERQFTVPSSLNASKGDIVYIDVTSLYGQHIPNDSAYSTSAGGNKVAFFKATSDQDGTFITGVVIPWGLAS
jgi:hypothetical protein